MEAHAFDSLGAIIAEGGLTSVATGIAHGWSDTQASEWVGKHWPGIDERNTIELLSQARSAVSGGGRLTDQLAELLPGITGEAGPLFEVAGPTASGAMDLEALRQLSLGEAGGPAWANEPIDISDLPLAHDLFGDEPLGRRGRIGLDVEFGDGTTKIRIDVDIAGVESWKDLLELIEERIQQIDDTDPTRFDKLSEEEQFDTVSKIIYGVRRW